MAVRRLYEWVIEELDNDGDIVGVDYSNKLHEEWVREAINGEADLGLCLRYMQCFPGQDAVDGEEIERVYAYFDKEFPTHFEDGAKVPINRITEFRRTRTRAKV